MNLHLPRHVWWSASAAAVTLWSLIWFLCTPQNAARLVDVGREGEHGFSVTGVTLAWWVMSWTRAEPPEDSGLIFSLMGAPTHVTAQILLTVALFGLGAAWVVRTVPPAGRSWPWTLAAGWVMSVGAVMVATALVALFEPRDASEPVWELGRGWVVGYRTGTGAPLVAAFGLLAAGVMVAVAVVARRYEPAGGKAPAGEASAGSLHRRGAVRAAVALAGVLALAVVALGNTLVVGWALDVTEDESSRLPLGLVRWLLPTTWGIAAETGMMVGVAPGYATIAAALLQVALAGGLFWLALHRLPSRSLPAVLGTAVWTGVLASAAGQITGIVLATFAPDADDVRWTGLLSGALAYVPGVLVISPLAGLAAWLVLRRHPEAAVPAEPAGPDAAGPDVPGATPGGGRDEDEGPEEDELVITVSR